MSTRKQQATERAAKVAVVRAEQQRKDRLHKLWSFGTVAVVCLALIAAVAVPLINQAQRRAEVEAGANAPIDGVQEFTDLSSIHVEGTVDYAMGPPVGGDHNAVVQNCGIYTEPLANENAVHSLEHGAVSITYSPDLAADQLAVLTDAAKGEDYLLVSPDEGLASPIVLTAWGLQLPLDNADDPRLATFITKYLQGPQTPEPTAACYGGIGTPAA